MSGVADMEVVLDVSGLGKCYSIYRKPSDRLLELLGRRQRHEVHWALRGVDLCVRRGQCFGVVGDNGAGKSTLLKLVAGALRPTEGRVRPAGRITAILELGAGFHPEFTGRENLYFYGAIIGIPSSEMARLEAEIIDFAELQDAIDRPVKTYSSGMVVRLAFGLVTAVEPTILIVDEALAVGDQHFQKKCLQRIAEFRRNGCAILFCSHSLYHVRKLCDQAIWLHEGRVHASGDVESVLAGYENHVRALDAPQPAREPAAAAPRPAVPAGQAAILAVEIDGLDAGMPPRLVTKDLRVTVTAQADDAEPPSIAVMLERADGICVTAVGNHADHVVPRRIGPGKWQSTVCFPDLPLYSGEYVISAYLFDGKGVQVFDEWLRYRSFIVVFPTLEIGLVRLRHEWT
jgi:lipopolysaccharide transport system ATP-binding protein